ncbi:MAG TPA: tripartite tricarboxylate transporter TctB family protein, partial [Candidatus Hydrogenedentes bacterium]|nr:tripartite tricarboxylate transporter TctB family protein [Candidatus Hydrogenedentota bacterium]
LALTGKFRRPPGQEPVTKAGAARIVLVVAAVLTYILLAERLGFVLAMALVVFVLLWRFRMRWPLAALVSALVVLAVYQIFAGYLGVPLPRGFWGG